MNIIIGTKNKNKVATVEAVFSDLLEGTPKAEAHDAQSGVPEAPHDQETYLGALNRALACVDHGDTDYYVGIESGLVERYGHMFEEAWAVIIHQDKQFIGYSSGLLLPDVVTRRMKRGELHNKVMEQIDRELDLPDDNRDTWSRYTGGKMLRTVSIEEAVRNALIQTLSTSASLYLR